MASFLLRSLGLQVATMGEIIRLLSPPFYHCPACGTCWKLMLDEEMWLISWGLNRMSTAAQLGVCIVLT